MLILSS